MRVKINKEVECNGIVNLENLKLLGFEYTIKGLYSIETNKTFYEHEINRYGKEFIVFRSDSDDVNLGLSYIKEYLRDQKLN